MLFYTEILMAVWVLGEERYLPRGVVKNICVPTPHVSKIEKTQFPIYQRSVANSAHGGGKSTFN